MKKQVFEKYNGSQVTDSMLQEASMLFTNHYGVWNEDAPRVVEGFAEAGKLALNQYRCMLRDTRRAHTA